MSALLQARLESALAPLVGTPGSALPDEIQWMPPGRHTITPLVNGQAKTITVDVTEAFASQLATDLRRLRVAATDGTGDVPYLDFNHDDGPASAEVLALRWAGEDPKVGGIRAKVAWTKAGRDALEGRTFRRFSPQWLIDEQTLQPIGIGVNMGGLVNRAAFQTISPVVAKSGAATTQQHNTMTDTEKNELKGLIAAAIEPITGRLTALEAKATGANNGAAATTQAAEVTELTNRVKALETARSEGTIVAARAKVQALAAEGKLPPQDQAGIEALASAIAANPAIEATLAKLPVNPAFKQLTAAAGAAAHGSAAAAADTAEGFVAQVAAKATEGKITKAAALDAVIANNPKGYAAWRAANGQPGL